MKNLKELKVWLFKIVKNKNKEYKYGWPTISTFLKNVILTILKTY